MGDRVTERGRSKWAYLVIGGIVGAALGVLVAATTDVPFAPEAGAVLGLLAGWLVHRART